MSNELHHGEIVTETTVYSLTEFCTQCGAETQTIVKLVQYGIIEPKGENINDWQFSISALQRAKQALRFHHELEINLAGVALSLELIDEIKSLHQQLQYLKQEDAK